MSGQPRGRGRARGRVRGTPLSPEEDPLPGTSTAQVTEEMREFQVVGSDRERGRAQGTPLSPEQDPLPGTSTGTSTAQETEASSELQAAGPSKSSKSKKKKRKKKQQKAQAESSTGTISITSETTGGGPQGTSGGPQGTSGGPQGISGSSRGAGGGPQRTSGGTQGTSGGPQGTSGGSRGAGGGPQKTSGGTQGTSGGPRGAGGGPPGTSGGPQGTSGGLQKAGGGPQKTGIKSGHDPKDTPSGVRRRGMLNTIIQTKPLELETKKGAAGIPIRLQANFFPLVKPLEWFLYHFDVKFSPELDDTKKKKQMLRQGFNSVNIRGYLFDGSSLYSGKRLHPPGQPINLTVKDEPTENTYKITVSEVRTVLWTDWHTLQVFNIIVRGCLAAMGFILIGRNYYDPKLKIFIEQHNLQLWPGFFTAMRQYESKVMLNVDLSFKVVRTDTIYDIYKKYGNDTKGFIQEILGTIVLTNYNNKTYRIDDVKFDLNPTSKFSKRDGSETTYFDYYKNRYSIRIRDLAQPMLISKSKPREIRAGMPELIILVPELCVLTGLSDQQRKNFQMMTSLNKHTCINPSGRLKELNEFVKKLKESENAMQILREWNMELADNVVNFEGRVLPKEKIYVANNRSIDAGERANWTHPLQNSTLFKSETFKKFVVICVEKSKPTVTKFLAELYKVAIGMGLKFQSRLILTMTTNFVQEYIEKIQKAVDNEATMVLVVLDTNSADRYNAIKKACYIQHALPCQVILLKNTIPVKGKENYIYKSIATKLAIQMNCKIGGAPWSIAMPSGTMVVGYDVCRDKVNLKKSYAGMVASTDMACARYYSHVEHHKNDEEISTTMGNFMINAVQAFVKDNEVPPTRILIYRDGVGEGDINYVIEHEVKDVKRQLKKKFYQKTKLQMMFIIVSKRINTKIFRAEPVGQQMDMNPAPGTVVDDVITWPERYDFYLVSQCVRQGTVTPTSYNIVDDNIGVGPDKIQQFTYKLTHMYFNWSGTIRVPAPCHYAHKLAFMTSVVLNGPANEKLNRTLYYL